MSLPQHLLAVFQTNYLYYVSDLMTYFTCLVPWKSHKYFNLKKSFLYQKYGQNQVYTNDVPLCIQNDGRILFLFRMPSFSHILEKQKLKLRMSTTSKPSLNQRWHSECGPNVSQLPRPLLVSTVSFSHMTYLFKSTIYFFASSLFKWCATTGTGLRVLTTAQ